MWNYFFKLNAIYFLPTSTCNCTSYPPSLSPRFKISLHGSSTYLIQEPLSLLGEARMVEICHRREDIPACTGHLLVNFVLFLKMCTFAVESTPSLNHEVNCKGGLYLEVAHKYSQIWAVTRWQQSQAPCFAAEWRNVIQTVMGRVQRSMVCKARLF